MGQLILTVCDHEHPDRVEASHHKVTVDDTTIEVDLCPEHEKPLLELLEQLRLVGQVEGQRRRRVPASAATPGEFDCPDCERTFKSQQGLSAHRGQRHYEGTVHKGPMDCPLCGKEFPSKNNVVQHLRGKRHDMGYEEAKATVDNALRAGV